MQLMKKRTKQVYHQYTTGIPPVYHQYTSIPWYTASIPWYTASIPWYTASIPWYTVSIPWYTGRIPWYTGGILVVHKRLYRFGSGILFSHGGAIKVFFNVSIKIALHCIALPCIALHYIVLSEARFNLKLTALRSMRVQ